MSNPPTIPYPTRSSTDPIQAQSVEGWCSLVWAKIHRLLAARTPFSTGERPIAAGQCFITYSLRALASSWSIPLVGFRTGCRMPQRSQLRGYQSTASFSTGEPRMKSNPSHHQWASSLVLDLRSESTVGFFASLSTPMPTPITHNFVAAVCRSRSTSSLARTSRGRGQPPQISS